MTAKSTTPKRHPAPPKLVGVYVRPREEHWGELLASVETSDAAVNGGGFTARLGCEMADRLAAIAAVAGGYDPLKRCDPDRPLPILEIHGTDDDVVPYEGTGEDRRGSDSGFLGVAGFLAQWTELDGCRGGPKQSTPRPGVSRTASTTRS